MHSPINPPDAPEVIGPFSHGVVASGRLLFVSGQGPQDPITKSFRLGDFEDETRLTLDNVTRVLKAAGADHVIDSIADLPALVRQLTS